MITQEELVTRRVSSILPGKDAFLELLKSGKKIRVFQGFDPSRPDLHIGHLVGLLQLKMFQDLGHEVIFLIGDFTGMIGDPTDKSATRPKLTREQVIENAKTYKDQASRILNFEGENPAKIVFNSTWLDKLSFADVLELSSNVTVQQLVERDMFQQRLNQNKPIYLHEFMYPLLQGYDSVDMEVDLEIGGNDQLFNMMMGRHLLKSLKDKEKYVMTLKLITDAAGNKIGKTTGNAVNLFGDPNDAFGQIMSFPDETVLMAFELATGIEAAQLKVLENQFTQAPMSVKKALAVEIVSMCHNSDKAQTAKTHFEKIVQEKEIPLDMPEVKLATVSSRRLVDILAELNLGGSNSERRRMIEQGGVVIDNVKVTDANKTLELHSGTVIKYGKRNYVKVI